MSERRYPDDNPKTLHGVRKVPYHLVPPSAVIYLATALKDGGAKYGPYNWRESRISSSTYIAACKRHIDAWWDGEERAEDSGVHHLAHAMACLALLLDADSVGMLNDDRPAPGAAAELIKRFTETAEEEEGPAAEPVLTKEQVDEYIRALNSDWKYEGELRPVENRRCPAVFISDHCERQCVRYRGHDGQCEREAPPADAPATCGRPSQFHGRFCRRPYGHSGLHVFE